MRLVLHTPQVASLAEIRNSWSIGQVMDYNEALDLFGESELSSAEWQKAEADAVRSARRGR